MYGYKNNQGMSKVRRTMVALKNPSVVRVRPIATVDKHSRAEKAGIPTPRRDKLYTQICIHIVIYDIQWLTYNIYVQVP